MSKILGVSLLSSTSKKGRTWEHGPGTPCKLLSSRSFSEHSKRFGKGVSSRSSLGCSFCVPEAKRNVPGNTMHVAPKTPFLKLLLKDLLQTPERVLLPKGAFVRLNFIHHYRWREMLPWTLSLGRTPKGSYSRRGHSGHLLETHFSATLLRTLFYCKPTGGPLLRTLLRTLPQNPCQNPSQNPS